MKIKWVMGGLAVIALLGIVGAALWYYMGKPMYEPGAISSNQAMLATLEPPPQAKDTAVWTVEPSVNLHHFESGSGRNVLMVHGGPGMPMSTSIPALASLESTYRFIYYDQRGCGQSTRPIDRFSSSNYYDNMQVLEKKLGLSAQIADIERIRRILGEEKITLIGHSFGGFLAALYAAEFPDRVKALVLIAPADTLVLPNPNVDFFQTVGNLLPADSRKEYEDFLKSYLTFGGIFSKSDSELAALNIRFGKFYVAAAKAKGFVVPEGDLARAGGWMVQAMYFSMGRRHDYRSALKNIKVPVLVLHGDKDIQSESASRVYAQTLPNAKFQVIKGAGHFPFLDTLADFSREVGEFLKAVN
jgi:proline iminopeptidase